MGSIYSRTELLVGPDAMERLKSAKVFVAGLGGVGGYIAEALARAGVGTLGLCDFDTVDETNINRQILALTSTVGRLKTDVCRERIQDINKDCAVELFPCKIDENNAKELVSGGWDYLADAIDDIPAKLALLSAARAAGTECISSMGTGNKLDPFSFKIVPVEKTDTCPLAKRMRKALKDAGTEGVYALYSTEKPVIDSVSRDGMPSISYMPSIAGLEIASWIIRRIIEK